MQRFERFVEVDAPVERVFDMFADFESYPRWMGGVREVRRVGRRVTRWVAETALDMDVEWDAETTVFEPDRRIVWRSIGGDVRADCEAVFAVTPEGRTLVRVVQGYDTPAGRTGERVARFFGRHPARQLEEDLSRFKRLAERESGGRSRGDDGRARRAYERAYSGRDEARERGRRDEPRYGRDARDERRYGREVRVDEGRRDRGSGAKDEASRRRRFDAELRDEARRDQRRAARLYEGEREERRREEGYRESDGRGGRDDFRRYEEERAPRFALTPRERERLRERDPRREEDARLRAGWYLRRGVDRLLDERPSGRWER